MFARNPAEAVDQLFDPLQRALSCVTPAVLTGRRYHEFPVPHALFFDAPSDPASLGRSSELALTVRHFYRLFDRRAARVESRWQLSTVGYIYELYDPDLERVVAYHQHPPGSTIDYPHLHVGRQFAHPVLPPDVRTRADRLVRSHLPTESVVLPTVLRLAIREFGVEPLRDDWREVLAETEQAGRASLLPR